MIQVPFFPGPVFAWAFVVVLLGLLAVASYTDLGRMIVPKRLSLTALALGVAFNLVRGAWLGAAGEAVWTLGPGGAWVGVVDGFLFALAGFALGFALFFLLWLLGACGGGDVKLFAALGAWVGPRLAIRVLGMTLVVVAAVVLVRVLSRLVLGNGHKTPRSFAPQGRATAGTSALQPRQRLLAFSLPLAIATAVVLLGTFRVELKLAAAPAMTAVGMGSHAR